MRKKLIALLGAGILLTGCGAAATSGEPSPTPTTTPSEDVADAWDGMTFCETFEDQREAYQSALDNPDGVRVADLSAEYRDWSDALKVSATPEIAEDVAAFTAPIYMTESGTVDLIAIFGAGNSLGQHCITG